MNEPPILYSPRLNSTELEFAVSLSRGQFTRATDPSMIPLLRDQAVSKLLLTVQRLGRILADEFPLIVCKKDVISKLLWQAAEYQQVLSSEETVRRFLILHDTFASVRSAFWAILEYMSGLARTDPLRKAIFANTLPYAWAWMNMHSLLHLDPPFIAPEYHEFLLEASQYVLPEVNKKLQRPWLIPFDRTTTISGGTLEIPFIFDTPESFPLNVLDLLGIPLDVSEDDFSVQPLMHQIDLLHANPDHSYVVDFLRAALIFMRYHPVAAQYVERGEFCFFVSEEVEELYARTVRSHPMKTLEIAIELTRLCGRMFWTPEVYDQLTDRPGPHMLRVPNNIASLSEAIGVLPMNALRSRFRFPRIPETDEFALFFKYLNAHIPYIDSRIHRPANSRNMTIRSKAQRVLVSIGTVFGLLFVEDDPGHFLENRYGDVPLQSLFHNSLSIWHGFCKVINCLALHTLFEQITVSEILQALRGERETDIDGI